MIHPSTFSIVACDLEAHAWGVAVASKFPAVGSVVPWAKASAGAVATQMYANTSFGPKGLAMMEEGLSAQETLERLLAEDPDREMRQVGLVDAMGGAVSYSGKSCYDWAGGISGVGFAAQGNILAGPEVVQAMAEAYENAKGPLYRKLHAALFAGDRAGGDRRGRQSAGIIVVRPGFGYLGFNDRWIDYRVDDHTDPVFRLGELLDLNELYFGVSPEEDKIPLEGQVLVELQQILHLLGYYQGEATGLLNEPTQRALRIFIGNENFEERVNFERKVIDKPVFNFLVRRFGISITPRI